MTAIQATFSDFKTIKTRKVAQLIFEVPIEQAMTALNTLGGVPQFASEQWVGIAPIKAETQPEPPEKPKRRLADMSLAQQAGILCNDKRFWAFVEDRVGWDNVGLNDAAKFVRSYCAVKSRSDLDSTPEAAGEFKILQTEFDVFTGRIAAP